jgi:hypothetical protein
LTVRSAFLRGLKAGEDCLRWRRELNNPNYTFSMAPWLRGIHRLALNDLDGARADFEQCVHYAELNAAENAKPTDLEGGESSVVFSHGMVPDLPIQGDEVARLRTSARGDLRWQPGARREAARMPRSTTRSSSRSTALRSAAPGRGPGPVPVYSRRTHLPWHHTSLTGGRAVSARNAARRLGHATPLAHFAAARLRYRLHHGGADCSSPGPIPGWDA